MKHSVKALFSILALSAIVALQTSCTSTPTDAEPLHAAASRPAAVLVTIDNFQFHPAEIEIAVGSTVTWQNADDVPHTATSNGGPAAFDSGPLDTDNKFSFTFNQPGKFTYYCKVHPHMTGVVIVK